MSASATGPGGPASSLMKASYAACAALLLWIANGAAARLGDRGEAWHHYDYLVDGFLEGQASLSVRPAPELLALRDPYDPSLNGPWRLWDASLYHGRFYLYFGPTPVLLLLPWRVLTGHHMPERIAVAAFAALGLLALALLIREVRRRHFPALSPAAAAGILAVATFASWLPVTLRRPEVWELPLVAACACLWWALYFLWRCLGAERGVRWAIGVGAAIALLLGSRPTCFFAGAAILALLFDFRRPLRGQVPPRGRRGDGGGSRAPRLQCRAVRPSPRIRPELPALGRRRARSQAFQPFLCPLQRVALSVLGARPEPLFPVRPRRSAGRRAVGLRGDRRDARRAARHPRAARVAGGGGVGLAQPPCPWSPRPAAHDLGRVRFVGVRGVHPLLLRGGGVPLHDRALRRFHGGGLGRTHGDLRRGGARAAPRCPAPPRPLCLRLDGALRGARVGGAQDPVPQNPAEGLCGGGPPPRLPQPVGLAPLGREVRPHGAPCRGSALSRDPTPPSYS